MTRTLIGTVVSNKMQQSAVVAVDVWKTHRLLNKRYRRTKKYLVHNQDNQFQAGDYVEIAETRPISKRKSWQITKIIDRSNKPTKPAQKAKKASLKA